MFFGLVAVGVSFIFVGVGPDAMEVYNLAFFLLLTSTLSSALTQEVAVFAPGGTLFMGAFPFAFWWMGMGFLARRSRMARVMIPWMALVAAYTFLAGEETGHAGGETEE